MCSYLPIPRRHQLITAFLQRQAEEEHTVSKKDGQKPSCPSSHSEGPIPDLASGPSRGNTNSSHTASSPDILLTEKSGDDEGKSRQMR